MIAKYFIASFQLRIGIVYFFAAPWIGGWMVFKSDSSFG